MRGFLAILILSATLAPAQRRERVSGKPNPLGRSEAVVTEGRLIYNKSCTVCHGLSGAVGDRGPALAGVRRYLRTSDEDLFGAIRNGIAGTAMPPSGLSENDAWKVVAYIRGLRATASDSFVKGDAAHGEKIFRGQGRCGDCHMIRGRGGLLGPDLSNVGGERTLSFLRGALTKPRLHVPRGYQPVQVVTADGQSLAGVVKNENNFSLQLLDNNSRLHLFTRDELRQVTYEKQSLMPGDYDKRLTPAEFEDLLAFLSRQTRQNTPQQGDEDLDR